MKKRRFFIDYATTPFLKTSITGASPNRLNWRAQVLLTENTSIIRGKKILDLGSHDGRFSYACLKLGARSIVAIEGRKHLVTNAITTFRQLGYTSDQYQFVLGDVFNELPRIPSGAFDTILCFGFFYHTTRQVELLSEIRRIRPKHLILDTTVETTLTNRSGACYLKIGIEDSRHEPNTILSPGVVGIPSRALVDLLLKAFGFKFTELRWRDRGIKDWSDIHDYETGDRISYLAEL